MKLWGTFVSNPSLRICFVPLTDYKMKILYEVCRCPSLGFRSLIFYSILLLTRWNNRKGNYNESLLNSAFATPESFHITVQPFLYIPLNISYDSFTIALPFLYINFYKFCCLHFRSFTRQMWCHICSESLFPVVIRYDICCNFCSLFMHVFYGNPTKTLFFGIFDYLIILFSVNFCKQIPSEHRFLYV